MRPRYLLGWLLLGAASLAAFVLAFPRTFPYLPEQWRVARSQAIALAEERLRDLGEPLADPYVEATLDVSDELSHRLSRLGAEASDPQLSLPLRQLVGWEVRFYARDAPPDRWTYQARISPAGEVTELRLQLPPEQQAGNSDEATIRERAGRFLAAQGYELGQFEAPVLRSEDRRFRTDHSLLYQLKSSPFGTAVPYGVRVAFAGDQLTGFETWLEDPDKKELGETVQGFLLATLAWRTLPFLLLPVVLVAFIRRYHEGEVGVRRGIEIVVVSLGLALVLTALCLTAMGKGNNVGSILSRQQVSWFIGIVIFLTYFGPMATLSGLSWSVGEVLCRDRWPRRLAAFDALCRGDWANSTVAAAALRGLMSGLGLAAVSVLGLLLLRRGGGWASEGNLFGPWWDSTSWLGLAMLAIFGFHALYSELFLRLLLTSAAVRWLGSWAGVILAVLAGTFISSPAVVALPMTQSIPLWILLSALHVLLFLRYGVATSLIATLTSALLLRGYVFLGSGHPWLELQAALPLLVVALPTLVSLRHLASDREFVYQYDDVPPHVRRIAERERQRVELETARRIQSSILPDLPPSLNGVEIAHSYQPASEVGGDFYDVLALEDGRLAVAVGDVAGHGVSSGLVMSMARSALAVQVTFNPEVAAVFSTLNRVVYQSARKRLLATLCYAVLDPERRELLYASAGHLYPYLITRDSKVRPLEYVAYPLGVRSELAVEARLARLDRRDTLFLLSDGLVEAHPPGSDEAFGFGRLEESLARHAHLGVESLRDAVLADVSAYTKGAPRDDDQTVLVLRVP